MRKITLEIMGNLKKKQIKFVDLVSSLILRKKLAAAFSRVLSSGNFILGKQLAEFEKQFASYLGVNYCIGVGNGLEALQISLMSLGIGRNDEVITTPISAVATTLAILAVGAKPIFVDTTSFGLINPDLIPASITKKTKAIMPVHLYGHPVQIEKIKQICQQHKLFLIEDAAQAHGSTVKGKKLGSFGTLGCFSFYPTKNLGALGDGGAVVTNDVRLAKICRQIRDYGQTSKYHHVRFGLNSRLDELQAALLKVKLSVLDSDNLKRQRLVQRYIRNLSHIPELEIVQPEQNTESNFHLFVIKTRQRDKLTRYLKRFGIETLIHFPTVIPDQPFLKRDYGSVSLPIARSFVRTCLSLPCYPQMTIGEVNDICRCIMEFYINN